MSFNIYEHMDSIDVNGLMKEVFKSEDLSKLSKLKDCKVNYSIDGKNYLVKSLVATRLKNRIKENDFGWSGIYDLAEAMKKMTPADEVYRQRQTIDPNAHTEWATYGVDEYNFNGMTKLTASETDDRVKFLTAIAGKILNEEVLSAIAEFAPKKKAGGFAKNKMARIVNLGIAYGTNHMICIVAKPKNDTTLEVILDERSATIKEYDFMAEDFVNTFINELGLAKFVPGAPQESSVTFANYLEKSDFKPVTEAEADEANGFEYDKKLFEIRNGVLIKGKGNHEEVIIPEGVTAIEKYAFESKKALKKLVIPESCKKIGAGAFRRCSNLTEVYFGDGVEVIEFGAFEYCGIENVLLGKGIKTIKEHSFSDCYDLFAIGAEDKVDIEQYAYYYSHIKDFWLFSMEIGFHKVYSGMTYNAFDTIVFHIRKGSRFEKEMLEYENQCRENLNSDNKYTAERAAGYLNRPIKYEYIPDALSFEEFRRKF